MRFGTEVRRSWTAGARFAYGDPTFMVGAARERGGVHAATGHEYFRDD